MFQGYLASAQRDALKRVAPTTANLYKQHIDNYIVFMKMCPDAPPAFPITVNNILAYLQRMKDKGLCYGTLRNAVSAFADYFKRNRIEDLTKREEVSSFMDNNRRVMNGDQAPFQTNPINKDMMTLICELPINSYGKKRNIAMITTQFYTLMRVSELISLNVEDLEISDECITIRIKRSKTDQYGAGRNVVIWKQENVITNPYKYILRWLDELPPHYKGPLFIGKKDTRYTANAYRRAVKVLAKKVGYDPNDYSSYSLRRGGAAYMGISSISAGAIKTIGGWNSSVFLRYIELDEAAAAKEIKKLK